MTRCVKYHIRHVGEVLDPRREPKSAIDETRSQVGPYVFAAQFQHTPVGGRGVALWFDLDIAPAMPGSNYFRAAERAHLSPFLAKYGSLTRKPPR